MGFFDLLIEKKDHARVVREIAGLFDEKNDPARQMMERVWWRNLLYYTGEQWLEYIRSTKSFVRRILPPNALTPVSNEIREYVRSQKAMLLNQKFVPKVFPNTNEREDQDAAELGEQVLIWMDSINDNEIDDEKEKVAIWTVLSGTGFLRAFPDKDAGALFLTPDGRTLRTGEVVTENVIPFNIRMDTMGDKLRLKRWVGIESLKPREWVEDTFKVKLSKPDMPSSLDYQRKLMNLVGQVNAWKGDGIENSVLNEDIEDLAIYREVEMRPTRKCPNGRYIVTSQDKCLVDVERMPIKVENGAWFYSLTDFHWNYVPGRFWSDSGVDDLISPQNIINQIDKALHDNRTTMGRPKVLTPTELTLKRLTEKGESFLALSYDGRASGGQVPAFQPGVPYPPQILEERRLQKGQIQDAAGDPKNILKGMPPSASASGVQVDILRETAEKGHYPDIDRFNRALTRVYKKRLLLAKELYTEERIIKIVGRGGTNQVKRFKGADLRENTDVRLELDSGLSTTKAGQTQILMDLAGKGFLGDVVNDPEARTELLRRYGLSGFNSKENVDIERADGENSAINNGDFSQIMLTQKGAPDPMTGIAEDVVINQDPLFKYDNHAVHYEIHRKFILGNEFKFIDPRAQQILVAHTDLHHQLMMADMQAQAMAQAQAAGAQAEAKGSKPNQGAPQNA